MKQQALVLKTSLQDTFHNLSFEMVWAAMPSVDRVVSFIRAGGFVVLAFAFLLHELYLFITSSLAPARYYHRIIIGGPRSGNLMSSCVAHKVWFLLVSSFL